jgi:hypothetical protein
VDGRRCRLGDLVRIYPVGVAAVVVRGGKAMPRADDDGRWLDCGAVLGFLQGAFGKTRSGAEPGQLADGAARLLTTLNWRLQVVSRS